MSTNPRPLYKKHFSRDFTLAFIEVWAKGEATVPRQYTSAQQPFLPYIVFESTKETVECYLDDQGIEWVKKEVAAKYSQDQEFITTCINEYLSRVQQVEHIWEGQLLLQHEELVRFLDALLDLWPWFEAVWWVIEMNPEDIGDENQQKAMHAREVSEKMNMSDTVIRKSLQQIFPDYADFAHVLTCAEIRTKQLPSPEELKNRTQGYFYAQGQLHTGKTRAQIEDLYNIELENLSQAENIEELKGMVAYKGRATGTVRRVMGVEQVPLVQEGEIIVASMTLPEFLPAMKKAAAFVTDEGGITCHAAIVARELQKPCIIGTKVATNVLQDGDTVEVDAEAGVVKKIKTAT